MLSVCLIPGNTVYGEGESEIYSRQIAEYPQTLNIFPQEIEATKIIQIVPEDQGSKYFWQMREFGTTQNWFAPQVQNFSEPRVVPENLDERYLWQLRDPPPLKGL